MNNSQNIYKQKRDYIDKKGIKPNYDDALWDIRKKLLEDIKMRKIWNVLVDYKNDLPIYISMTDMLLKTAVEYYWSHKDDINIINVDKKADDNEKINYKFVIDQIKKMDFSNLDNIVGDGDNCINKLIEKRKYHEFDLCNKERILIYENYLKDIKQLRKNIQNSFIKKDKKNGRESLGKVLQDMGDNIRSCSNPFDSVTHNDEQSENLWKLSEQANNVIKYYKNRYRFWEGSAEYSEYEKPHIFIIENFRNPAEAEYFRLRYYEFFLISIHCNKQIRLKREKENINKIYKIRKLTQENIESYFNKIDKRDIGKEIKSEKDLCMQNVSKSVYIADIAIINETDMKDFKKNY